MNRTLAFLIAGLIPALALSLALPARAEAADICNHTSFVLRAAVGWPTEGGAAVRGWTRLRPGECLEIEDELDRTGDAPLYLYARTSEAYLGGVREWRGETTLCVDETDFDIVSRSGGCASLGLTPRGFVSLTGDNRDQATLVEPEDYGARADEAGLQRLLRAAGYEVAVIDGYAGRRTRGAVSEFLDDAGLESQPSDGELIDALEAAALRRNAASGLTLCNEASAEIAAAIGRRRAEVWESRGWWRLQPGECTRVLAEYLQTPSAFIYAERLGGGRRRPIINGEERFCFAPSRFLSEGRDDCAVRGYGVALYRRMPDPEGGGARILLSDEDFDALRP